MCPIIAQEHYPECGDTIEVDTGKRSTFCLFGAYCQEVRFAITVFRRRPGSCPRCYWDDDDMVMRKKPELAPPHPGARVPQYRHDKERCVAGALAETQRILSDATLTDKKCKALLQYILDLPAWVKKGQLVAAFGYGVMGYYGAAWEGEMLGLATRKHFDKCLLAGMQKKLAEV